MTTKKVGYIRVSSAEQSVDRQLVGIELNKHFVETMSVKTARTRPILTECINYLRSGDELYVHSIDRLARNILDLQNIIAEIINKGASVKFVSERLEFSSKDDPFAQLTMQMLGAFAEFERKLINIRQREGMQVAKAKGKHIGRPSLLPEVAQDIRQKAAEGVSKSQISKECGVSRQTVYRVLNSDKE
ncbi:recombinase family protein [Vibrio splendidus]|uniref:recombinase family protein n=1 Tax=Vibrio splendidus TaxID=29497 RepID=UPI002736413C|nr:recombinase family protein [Vibrio splendidus]MDP2588245.1 recombinase family protein [Vibrio splendidus]